MRLISKPNAFRMNLLSSLPRFPISHIKNMYTEKLKYEIEQEHGNPLIEDNSRIYKPTYPIEFNREGEVLLFSCEPTKEVKI
jgi:hypothetical protein